ncbi:unnamed protein product, partial [Polarella glacialis]
AATASSAVDLLATQSAQQSVEQRVNEGAHLHWQWGTPVLARPLPDVAGLNAALASHFRSLAASEAPEIRSNRNGAWQSRNKKVLDPKAHPAGFGLRKHIRRLRDHIAASLREYLGEAAEFATITIDASWANVNPQNGMNGPHVHPFSAISGAYYVDCGSNATSQVPCVISLMDPRPSAAMAQVPSEVRDSLDFGFDMASQGDPADSASPHLPWLSALKSAMDEMEGMMQCLLTYQCASMCCSQVPQMPSVHHVEKVSKIPKYIEKVVEVPVYKYVEKIVGVPLYNYVEHVVDAPIYKHAGKMVEKDSNKDMDAEERDSIVSGQSLGTDDEEEEEEEEEEEVEVAQEIVDPPLCRLCRGNGHIKCRRRVACMGPEVAFDSLILKTTQVFDIADKPVPPNPAPDSRITISFNAGVKMLNQTGMCFALSFENIVFRSEVEETLNRIKTHKGVSGIIIVNSEGVPIRSSLDSRQTLQYSALISQLAAKARSVVRDLDPQNDLTFLRIRSKKHEIMVAPDREHPADHDPVSTACPQLHPDRDPGPECGPGQLMSEQSRLWGGGSHCCGGTGTATGS